MEKLFSWYSLSMTLISLCAAARMDGAPSQPMLSKIFKKANPPPFMKNVNGRPKVDVDDPSWAEYISRSTAKQTFQTERGNLVKKTKAGDYDDDNEKKVISDSLVKESINTKIFYDSLRAKYIAQLAEIDLNEKKALFVNRKEALYWFSFIQRGILDSFSVLHRAFPETKRLIVQGDDEAAEKYLSEKLKGAFEDVITLFKSEIEDRKSVV
jgi:hypothetical protein